MLISVWSSDVCSSGLTRQLRGHAGPEGRAGCRLAACRSLSYPHRDFLEPRLVRGFFLHPISGRGAGFSGSLGPPPPDGFGAPRRPSGRMSPGIRLTAAASSFISPRRPPGQIGSAHVWTPVTNAHLVCRTLLENKKQITSNT